MWKNPVSKNVSLKLELGIALFQAELATVMENLGEFFCCSQECDLHVE